MKKSKAALGRDGFYTGKSSLALSARIAIPSETDAEDIEQISTSYATG